MLKSLDMNIGIFCPKDSISAAKIKFEAESRSHLCRRMRLTDLYVEVTDEGLKVEHRKFDLKDFDVIIFRKIHPFDSEIASITAKYLISIGKRVIDESILIPNSSLLDLEKLANAKVPLMNRVITPSIKSSRDVLMDFEHPVIVKPLDLPSDRYTFSEDWTESFDIVRSEKSKRYEIIKAVQNEGYIKIYLIGFQIIGAIKRKSIDPEAKLNLGRKFKSAKYNVDENLQKIAVNAAESVGYEICSIDLVETDTGWRVIELDRAPNFSTFNKIYNSKFETKIIDYISK